MGSEIELTKLERLDIWNEEKKKLDTILPINQDSNKRPKFTIKSWHIWWYYIGENVGKEFGSHFDKESESMIHKRPGIIVSTNKMLSDSKHFKVIILPLSSIKEYSVQQNFHHKLLHSNYPNIKDSFVLCNEIKVIDVRRLSRQITRKAINQEDIDGIKSLMCNYIDI